MYGLVNQAVEDLVLSSAGPEAWREIKKIAGVDDPQFNDFKNYPDDVTFALVEAASEYLMHSPEDILKLFGRHWILYTGRKGWHEFFEVDSTGVISFLEQLNAMHARVETAMAGARLPRFDITRIDDTHYEVTYASERTGFAPMVTGILEGLAEYYEEPWVIEQTKSVASDGVNCYSLRNVAAVIHTTHKAA